jgi:soluble lytic murein transglycosylase-like protein
VRLVSYGRIMLPRDRRHDLKSMKNRKNTQQAGRSASRRNSFASIIRSRTVQGVLMVAAGMQGATVVIKHQHGDVAPQPATASAIAASMTAMPAPAPVKAVVKIAAAKPVKVAKVDTTAARGAVAKTAVQKAHTLAEKYRAKGYTVTPALANRIHEAALETGIKPEVAFGLVRTESAFKSSATSHVGAVGLTQLMPKTASWLEPGTTRSDLRNPDTNLRIGFKYLARLIDRYDGNTRLALLAYNRGPGTVDRVLRRGGNPDNGYADMVLHR